jgi:2-keto-3-deoxy-L-rhamnonate aldolase RhmA
MFQKIVPIPLIIVCLNLVCPVSADHHGKSLTDRWRAGETMQSVRVPSGADRDQVHEFIEEQKPDILYLDLHHMAGTEWDMSRIVKAAQEKDIPVMVRIDHAAQAPLISAYLDLGVFSIKVPTVEDEATVQAIIDAFYYPPLGNAASAAPTTGGNAKKLVKKIP